MPLSSKRCRELIGEKADDLLDEEVLAVRDSLHALASIVVEIWDDLAVIDQSTLTPYGDVVDQLDAIARTSRRNADE
jgi:hypothetical protein